MKRDFDFSEIVTYRHTIQITAKSEEELDRIEKELVFLIDDRCVRDKDDMFGTIKVLGGDYEFVEDESPDVEYE